MTRERGGDGGPASHRGGLTDRMLHESTIINLSKGGGLISFTIVPGYRITFDSRAETTMVPLPPTGRSVNGKAIGSARHFPYSLGRKLGPFRSATPMTPSAHMMKPMPVLPGRSTK